MTSRSRTNKLIAAATKQCNNDVVSRINSKFSNSKFCASENSENVRLTNVLFSQIMKDKSFNECNIIDLKNNTVEVDNYNVYEEITIESNQINNNNCLTDSSSKESSELSRDTEDWLPKSVIIQNNLNLSGNNNSECNSVMDTENIFNVSISKRPSRQLFETDEILFEEVETCSISNSFLGIECLEVEENELEEVCVVGEEGRRKKKKVNIRTTKQVQKLNGVGKFVKINSCITKKKCQFKCYEKFSENDRYKLYLIIFGNLEINLDNVTF